MKKLLSLLTLLFIVSCAFTDNKTETDLHQLKAFLPAFKTINDYQLAWNKARANSVLWTQQQQGDTRSKAELKHFVNEEYPKMRTALNKMVADSVFDASDNIPGLCFKMDQLAAGYKEMMQLLSTFESYEDPSVVFLARPMVTDADGDYELLFRDIDAILQRLKEKTSAQLEKELQQASR